MRLTTVGTGTASPSPTRVSSGHHVSAGDLRLLMDCGSGVVHRMASLGVRWQDVTHVALTHFHADHVGDLPALIFAWRYGDLPARTAPATILGPVGTVALVEGLAAALGEWVREPGFPLHVVEVAPGDRHDLGGGVGLEVAKVPHTAESVGYAVTHASRRLVYTGDTGYDEEVAAWSRDCDLLLAECSLPSGMAMEIHLTPEQCGRLAHAANARRLALTHFYPPVERVDVRVAVAREYDGPVHLAHDGWTLEL